MKIAHVIHGFPPFNNAGAEIYTYKIAREQARTEQVAVFHRIGDPKLEEYAVTHEHLDGLNVWRVNNTLRKCRSYEEIYTNPGVAEAFRGFLDTVKPDVAHIGHLTMLSTQIVEMLAERGIPRVMTLHDFWLVCLRGQLLDRRFKICADPGKAWCEECHPEQAAVADSSMVVKAFRKLSDGLHLGEDKRRALFGTLYRFLAKRRGETGEVDISGQIRLRREHMKSLCEKIDLFISPSNFLREQMVSFGIVKPERIIHSANGQDTAPFKDFRRAPSKKVRFGFVGAIIPSKGLHVLLEAFKGIDPKSAEINVHGGFVEYHEQRDYPERIKALSARPGVNMHGAYEAEDVAKAYADIDVLVVPSIWYENSPLVIHEAFMAGAPVIASNAGGMAELVKQGENGLLFELGNAKSLREAMQRIIDDPMLVEKLRRGIPRVKTIEENASELLGIYRRLMQGR
jgi:glycosyltransferase involved in cell wall biosynthesis